MSSSSGIEPHGVKIVYLAKKRPELPDEEFIHYWTTTHAGLASALPGLLAYSINSPSNLQRGPRPIDGYAMLRFASRAAAKDAWTAAEGITASADGELFMAQARHAIVDERVVVPAAEDGPKLKVVYLVTKRPELSDADFVNHWTTVHAELASRLPGLLAYSINLPSVQQRRPRSIDGYAMLQFESWNAAKSAWRTPAGRATAADGDLFMAEARPAIVDELVVRVSAHRRTP